MNGGRVHGIAMIMKWAYDDEIYGRMMSLNFERNISHWIGLRENL